MLKKLVRDLLRGVCQDRHVWSLEDQRRRKRFKRTKREVHRKDQELYIELDWSRGRRIDSYLFTVEDGRKHVALTRRAYVSGLKHRPLRVGRQNSLRRCPQRRRQNMTESKDVPEDETIQTKIPESEEDSKVTYVLVHTEDVNEEEDDKIKGEGDKNKGEDDINKGNKKTVCKVHEVEDGVVNSCCKEEIKIEHKQEMSNEESKTVSTEVDSIDERTDSSQHHKLEELCDDRLKIGNLR